LVIIGLENVMASQIVGGPQSASAPTEPLRRKLLPIFILAALIIASGIAARRGYPQLAAPIVGLPAAFEVLRRLIPPGPTPPPGIKVFTKRNPVFWRRACIAGIVLFIYALGCLTPILARVFSQPSVWLESPATAISPSMDAVLGWKGLSAGQRAAVFVYSGSDRKYYPAKCGFASASGQQSCSIDIGVVGDRGKTFELLSALLSPAAEAVVKKYWSDPTAAGLTELPEGTFLFEKKTVVRTN
jgi:hypothetical protein